MKKLLRSLYYWLSPRLRLKARQVFYWPLDTKDLLLGKRTPMVPPRGLTFTGAGDFLQEGRKYSEYFQKYGLMPHHHVLDVGCGLGRMAVPLTQYLNQEGGYLGFDIMPQAINWCKKEIESRFPRFRFLPYSSGNDLYNLKAQANRPFPTESQYFDFAILTSVFSHLQPEETAFFLKELHRTLKLGGVVFATFFIFTDEERPPFNPEFAFPFDYGDYCLMDKRVKGANVAYRKSWLDKAIQNSGFSVAHHLPGFWLKGKSETTFEFQDILILQK